MILPYLYVWRNLWARKVTTGLTVLGMALVVFVFASVLMLAEGLTQTLVTTGSPDNVIAIRQGSENEVQSNIDRTEAALIESLPEIAYDRNGEKQVSRETLVLMVLQKRDGDKRTNVIVRGLSHQGLALRPQVRLVAGRLFRPGAQEIVAGVQVAKNIKGVGMGESLHFGLRDWRVVGLMDGGSTGFSSEIWGDVSQLMQAFRRNTYSSILFMLPGETAFDRLKQQLDADPRLTVAIQRENRFYAAQAGYLGNFLKILGTLLSVVFSLGAMIGALITLYGAVASRTREIGTLRALGFSQTSILAAFLLESLLLGLVGGVVGLVLASGLQWVTVSTMNWQSFSELAFAFVLTPRIALMALGMALMMGLLGGLLPALRAARMDVIQALRVS